MLLRKKFKAYCTALTLGLALAFNSAAAVAEEHGNFSALVDDAMKNMEGQTPLPIHILDLDKIEAEAGRSGKDIRDPQSQIEFLRDYLKKFARADFSEAQVLNFLSSFGGQGPVAGIFTPGDGLENSSERKIICAIMPENPNRPVSSDIYYLWGRVAWTKEPLTIYTGLGKENFSRIVLYHEIGHCLQTALQARLLAAAKTDDVFQQAHIRHKMEAQADSFALLMLAGKTSQLATDDYADLRSVYAYKARQIYGNDLAAAAFYFTLPVIEATKNAIAQIGAGRLSKMTVDEIFDLSEKITDENCLSRKQIKNILDGTDTGNMTAEGQAAERRLTMPGPGRAPMTLGEDSGARDAEVFEKTVREILATPGDDRGQRALNAARQSLYAATTPAQQAAGYSRIEAARSVILGRAR